MPCRLYTGKENPASDSPWPWVTTVAVILGLLHKMRKHIEHKTRPQEWKIYLCFIFLLETISKTPSCLLQSVRWMLGEVWDFIHLTCYTLSLNTCCWQLSETIYWDKWTFGRTWDGIYVLTIALFQIFFRVQPQAVINFLHTSQLLHLILLKLSPSLWVRSS